MNTRYLDSAWNTRGMNHLMGTEMHQWASALFPLNRSLTGDGVRQTLAFIKKHLPNLEIFEVASGTDAFDWKIPKEWAIKDGWIADLDGKKLIDFRKNNLHVMGYSTPIDKIVSRDELESHLFSLPDLPDAIPYVTSYYKEDYGFCLSEVQKEKLGDGPFHIYIDSELFEGAMTYAELKIPGKSTEEIFFSTYVCHPSMGNNELSGPVVAMALAKHIESTRDRRYTYRFLFTVENIGATYYISKHLEGMKKRIKAGWVLTCIGDNRTYSYLPTRVGDTLTDSISRQILRDLGLPFREYSWLEGGSDERRYNSPGVELPIGSLMRSMYGKYPEYHTSLDDLELISPDGLLGGLKMLENAVQILETNFYWKIKTLCEPQLGKRGLYPNTSTLSAVSEVRNLMNVISFLDGKLSTIEIADKCKLPYRDVQDILNKLELANLIEKV
jgi:aminopeptidase-like protein